MYWHKKLKAKALKPKVFVMKIIIRQIVFLKFPTTKLSQKILAKQTTLASPKIFSALLKRSKVIPLYFPIFWMVRDEHIKLMMYNMAKEYIR